MIASTSENDSSYQREKTVPTSEKDRSYQWKMTAPNSEKESFYLRKKTIPAVKKALTSEKLAPFIWQKWISVKEYAQTTVNKTFLQKDTEVSFPRENGCFTCEN